MTGTLLGYWELIRDYAGIFFLVECWADSILFKSRSIVVLQATLSLGKMDKFGSTLHATLLVFAQLLEVAGIEDVGRCAEEALDHLKATIGVSPVATVIAVHQVSECLIKSELVALIIVVSTSFYSFSIWAHGYLSNGPLKPEGY